MNNPTFRVRTHIECEIRFLMMSIFPTKCMANQFFVGMMCGDAEYFQVVAQGGFCKSIFQVK
jgi:hypothetical protein